MSYDIFACYGLGKIKDSLTENFDYKNNNVDNWKQVNQKQVQDSDGFMTDYTWYTNGEKHIFMFGDSDLYEPDEDYSDWETESEEEAAEWFDSYKGFSDDLYDIDYDAIEDEFEDTPTGNSDFMNDGFNNVYGDGLDLED